MAAIFRSPYSSSFIFDDGNPDYDYNEMEDDILYVAIMMMTIINSHLKDEERLKKSLPIRRRIIYYICC